MKININIRRRDVWNFAYYGFRHIPIYAIVFYTGMIGVPIYIFYHLFNSGFNYPLDAKILTGIFLSLAGDLFFYLFLIICTMLIPIYKKGVLGEHIIEINQNGIREKTDFNDGFHYWKGIKKIKQNSKYIYIFITQNMAHVIPKRSFSAREQANEFYNLAISYWNNRSL